MPSPLRSLRWKNSSAVNGAAEAVRERHAKRRGSSFFMAGEKAAMGRLDLKHLNCPTVSRLLDGAIESTKDLNLSRSGVGHEWEEGNPEDKYERTLPDWVAEVIRGEYVEDYELRRYIWDNYRHALTERERSLHHAATLELKSLPRTLGSIRGTLPADGRLLFRCRRGRDRRARGKHFRAGSAVSDCFAISRTRFTSIVVNDATALSRLRLPAHACGAVSFGMSAVQRWWLCDIRDLSKTQGSKLVSGVQIRRKIVRRYIQ